MCIRDSPSAPAQPAWHSRRAGALGGVARGDPGELRVCQGQGQRVLLLPCRVGRPVRRARR
eukprot:5995508-Alexandrium_andersonii.AAC.1